MKNGTGIEIAAAYFDVFPLLRRIVLEAFDRHENKLTRTQQMILVSMKSGEVLSMSKLARRINTSNEQATRAISQLTKKNMVLRFQNEDNHRVVNIVLTETADKYVEEVKQIAADMLDEEFSELTKAQKAQLAESLFSAAELID